jgi:hypothetical protein
MQLTSQTAGRHYRLRWTKPINQGTAVFGAVVWLVFVLGSTKPNWTVVILLGVWVLIIAVWANVLAVTAGLYEDESGILIRSPFRATRYEWTQLAGFEHAPSGTHDYVFARLTDGRRHRLANVLQGQRVLWDGGQTKDIVGVLCARLAEEHARGIGS